MTHEPHSSAPAPSPLPAGAPVPRRGPWPWVLPLALVALTMVALRIEGRLWFCECGTVRVWVSDVWTSHCSQHFADPYSITHFSHGLIFFAALVLLTPRLSMGWRFTIAIAIAAAWEVLENSPIIINRYRAATMSLDYLGDSAVNAAGDILFCAAGFATARAIGLAWSAAVFATTELALLWLIRDNLSLNVIMLAWPVDAIREWQSAGAG